MRSYSICARTCAPKTEDICETEILAYYKTLIAPIKNYWLPLVVECRAFGVEMPVPG